MFTPEQIEKLRDEYGKSETISTDLAVRLGKFLSSLSQAMLKQLAEAGIRFVSVLARNRLKK